MTILKAIWPHDATILTDLPSDLCDVAIPRIQLFLYIPYRTGYTGLRAGAALLLLVLYFRTKLHFDSIFYILFYVSSPLYTGCPAIVLSPGIFPPDAPAAVKKNL